MAAKVVRPLGRKSIGAMQFCLATKPEPKKMTLSNLAIVLGVTRATVASWANGKTIPRADQAYDIEKLLGISSSSWGVFEK